MGTNKPEFKWIDFNINDKEYIAYLEEYYEKYLIEKAFKSFKQIIINITLITFILAFFISTLLAIGNYSKYKYAVIEYQKANETATYYIKLNKQIMQVNEDLNFKLGTYERKINNTDTK